MQSRYKFIHTILGPPSIVEVSMLIWQDRIHPGSSWYCVSHPPYCSKQRGSDVSILESDLLMAGAQELCGSPAIHLTSRLLNSRDNNRASQKVIAVTQTVSQILFLSN